MRKKAIFLLAIMMLFTSGCASLQKKFTRKKKQEEKPRPVIAPEKFTPPPVADRYREYFTYWKYWQIEMINNLAEKEINRKRLLGCAEGAFSNLENFQALLVPEKREALEQYRKELLVIRNGLKDSSIDKNEYSNLRQKLERQKRIIENNYGPKEAKNFLISE
jgi:hypothetical protein